MVGFRFIHIIKGNEKTFKNIIKDNLSLKEVHTLNIGFEKVNVYHDGGENPFEPGKVYMEPLERGFSDTIGNALRRIMLSSMPGASVIGVKIPGVVHELSTIPGAVTDTVELILNLKKLRFKLDNAEEMYTVRFEADKTGIYTGKDLELPTGVELMNPEQEVINIIGGHLVEMEIYVKMGRGFVDASMHTEFHDRPDIIAVDGTFSPIIKVGYKGENMRLGQDASYERLILDVTTDGSLHPKEAVDIARKILHAHLGTFDEMTHIAEKTKIFKEKQEEENRILDLPIEHLELSVRSYNCLKREKLLTVKDVIKLREDQLYAIQNLGEKSVKEIISKIEELGLEFRKD